MEILRYLVERFLNRRRADFDWRSSEELFGGPIMRRRSSGVIETRPMTADEASEYVKSRAGW